jgi:hypothetical protein
VGKGLEMINLNRSLPRRLAVVLGLAALLAGCGNAPDSGFGGKETLALAKALVPAGKNLPPAASPSSTFRRKPWQNGRSR